MSHSDYRIIRPGELIQILGISTATLYQWIDKGFLPPKVQIGPKAVGWDSRDIDAWLDSRRETREMEEVEK